MDAFALAGGRCYAVEAKVRDFTKDHFATMLVEEQKLTTFRALDAAGLKCLLVVFYTDATVVYNISARLEQERQQQGSQLELHVKDNLPRNTMKNRGRTSKNVAFLSPSTKFKDRVHPPV